MKATKLKLALLKKGMTQREVAHRSGLDYLPHQFAWDTESGQALLDSVQDSIVAAAGTPAHGLVRDEVFLRVDGKLSQFLCSFTHDGLFESILDGDDEFSDLEWLALHLVDL